MIPIAHRDAERLHGFREKLRIGFSTSRRRLRGEQARRSSIFTPGPSGPNLHERFAVFAASVRSRLARRPMNRRPSLGEVDRFLARAYARGLERLSQSLR